MMMPMGARFEMGLGSLLLEKKLINQSMLNGCIERQNVNGGYLSQHLIELGYMKDADLASCLTCFYGFSYVDVNSYVISESAKDTIPLQLVCDYCLIPIEKNDKLLTVVMADPLNSGVLEILRQITRCQIIVFISTRTEIINAIEKTYLSPYKTSELDRFKDDPVLRANICNKQVSNGLYKGPNRRRYKRLYTELPGEYVVYPNVFKTRVLNIGMRGILFESGTALGSGTNMAMNVHLDNSRFISGVVEVKRCESKNIIDPIHGNGPQTYHEVGSLFNFMTDDNLDMLARYLRQRLN